MPPRWGFLVNGSMWVAQQEESYARRRYASFLGRTYSTQLNMLLISANP
jgi:hypothetical protein